MAQDAAPADPAGPSPRRPGLSVRRTSSIDVHWPNGLGADVHFAGHARDIFTALAPAEALVLAEDWLKITASPGREILAIETSRMQEAAQGLVGARGGGQLRAALAQCLPDEQSLATPLHLLLDDFSGASLVATWAWSRWDPEWQASRAKKGVPITAGNGGQMEGICAGFRPGSSALLPDGTSNPHLQSSATVLPLASPDDPQGWHSLPLQSGVGHRRARRLDVHEKNGIVVVDAGFQDSASTPIVGERQAVHEYRVLATASPEDLTLLSIKATPYVLPYRECPAASLNVGAMIGQPLSLFRRDVPHMLKGIVGCTHLNDVLRSFADVPAMLKALRKQVGRS